MIAALLLSLLLATAPEAEARVHRLPPVDQCAADPSFVAFRNDLLAAIARHDRDFVLAAITDDIELDFGGGAGREEFARTWELDHPETSGLWDELGRALSLGCAHDGRNGDYYAPSMFMADEEVFEDPFTAAVAIRLGAELRSGPDTASPVVATLDWDVLTVPEWDPESDWQRVALADGRSG